MRLTYILGLTGAVVVATTLTGCANESSSRYEDADSLAIAITEESELRCEPTEPFKTKQQLYGDQTAPVPDGYTRNFCYTDVGSFILTTYPNKSDVVDALERVEQGRTAGRLANETGRVTGENWMFSFAGPDGKYPVEEWEAALRSVAKGLNGEFHDETT